MVLKALSDIWRGFPLAVFLLLSLFISVNGQARSPGRWEKLNVTGGPPAVVLPCTDSVDNKFFMYGGFDGTSMSESIPVLVWLTSIRQLLWCCLAV
jgi:hypothetical protein